MPDPGLETLLERYRDRRDDAAMAELVRRTRSRLLRVARRIVPADLAEDCAQLAYLSLVRDRGAEFRPQVLPWLVAATVRIAYAAKAKERRQQELARRLEHAADERAERDDVARLVRARVHELPSVVRNAVVLHHLEGLALGEVALLLDISLEAAKKRVQRGRALLRSRLHPRLLSIVVLPLSWLRDRGAPQAGGVVVKKNLAAALVLVLLALLLGGGWHLAGGGEPAPPRADRVAAEGREPAEPPPSVSYTFTGRVLDATGAGIAGARVAGAGAAAVSGEGGAFELRASSERTTLRGEHEGRADEVEAIAGRPCVLRLLEAQDIAGVVVDPQGKAIAGANVTWRGASMRRVYERSARADAEGRFRLARVPRIELLGASWLEIRAEGHATGAFQEFEGRDEFVLTRGAFVEGVVRGESGEPMAGAPVIFFVRHSIQQYARAFFGDPGPWEERTLARATTGPDGRYRIGPVPARGYGDAVSGRRTAGHVGVRVDGAFPASQIVPVVDPGETVHRDLEVRAFHRVAGEVVDDEGRAVPDARWELSCDGDEIADGAASADGRLDVPLSTSARERAPLLLIVRPPERYRSEVSARHAVTPGEPLGTIVLAGLRRPAIPVVVRDAAGAPVEGARVGLSQDRFLNQCYPHAFTGADGTAVLDDAGESDRPQHLYVEAVGFAPAVAGPLDPLTRRAPVNVTLAPARALEGRVTWRDGTPAGGVYIDASTTETDELSALTNAHRRQPAHHDLPALLHLGSVRTDADGRFFVGQLPAGRCRLLVRAYAESRDGRYVVAAARAEVETDAKDVRLVLEQGEPGDLRTVRGRVVAESTGRPVGEFTARLVRGTRVIPARVIRAGVFRIDGVPAGEWQLEIEAPGFKPCLEPGFDVDAGPVVIELAPGIRIDGQLRGVDRDAVHVRFVRTDGRVTESVAVRPDGTFATSDLRPGTWFAFIEDKKREVLALREPGPIVIREDVRALPLDREVVPGARLMLMMRDAKEVRATVTIRDAAGKEVFRAEQTAAIFHVPLPPGEYAWELRARDDARAAGRIHLRKPGHHLIAVPDLVPED